MRETHTIPRAPIGRIILNSGAKRVSAEAVDAFAEILTQVAMDIGGRAVRIAKHSGRKTVHESDIKLAVKP